MCKSEDHLEIPKEINVLFLKYFLGNASLVLNVITMMLLHQDVTIEEIPVIRLQFETSIQMLIIRSI
jgi:hypothetical protein